MNKLITIITLILIAFSINAQKVSTGQIKQLIKSNDQAAIQSLLDNGLDINTRFRGKQTMLHFATEEKNFQLVKFLVERGADMNMQTKDLWTPLYLSTSSIWRNDTITEFLVQNGANMDIGEKHGFTPIFNTVYETYQNTKIFKLLADSGANLNIVCPKCCNLSLFILVCMYGNTEMLKILKENSIDFQQKNCQGRNGLILAIYSKNYSVLSFLLKNGVSKYEKDNSGLNAIDYAAINNDETSIILLNSIGQ